MANLPTTPGQRPAAVANIIEQLKAEMAAEAPALGRGRMLFALDATASREETWDRACHIQNSMFEAVASLGGLDVQLVYYRGYDECKASRWMTTAADLRRVMAKVACRGGYSQIAKVLAHAIRETGRRKVGAIVFVGDAMEEKLDELCQLAGELGRLNTPVFALHEGDDSTAANAFKQIASLSKGAYLPFDIVSIDRLRELLAAVAIFASGGFAALEKHAQGKPELLRITSQLKR